MTAEKTSHQMYEERFKQAEWERRMRQEIDRLPIVQSCSVHGTKLDELCACVGHPAIPFDFGSEKP